MERHKRLIISVVIGSVLLVAFVIVAMAMRHSPTNGEQSTLGLGISRDQIVKALPHFDFSDMRTVDGVCSCDGINKDSGLRILLSGPPGDLESILLWGALSDHEMTGPTSFALGILLNEVTPDWPGTERLDWFANAAVASEQQPSSSCVRGGVLVSVLTQEAGQHVVTFGRQ